MAVQLHGMLNGIINILPERFERKYYLAPGEVGLAYGLLHHTCFAAREYPSEQINSLYFDTPDLDQYGRSEAGDFSKDKIRIRWYGNNEDMNGVRVIFIELKSRRGFASTKQRLKLHVPAESLALENLGKGIVSRSLLVKTLARFNYFPLDTLQPMMKISYWRYRFSEIMTAQRISLDCHIRSTVVMSGKGHGERELRLPGGVMEFKGRTTELPIALARVRMLDTDWTRFSKCSACIDSHIERLGAIGRLSPSGRILQL
jgi:hypothetical protein